MKVQRQQGSLSDTAVRPAERWVGRLLIGFVAFVPLPLGGFLPIAWAFEAVVVGILAIAFAVATYRGRRIPHSPSIFTRLILGLSLCLMAALMLQLLPIGRWIGPVEYATADHVRLSSDWLSLAPGDTFLMLLRVVTYTLFFFMLHRIARSRRFCQEALLLLYSIVVAYALLGLVLLHWGGDTLLWVDKWAYRGDATATFVNRNTFATFLAMGLAAGLSLLMKSLFPRQRDEDESGVRRDGALIAYMITSLLIVCSALLSTHSRMGLVAAVIGGVVVVLLGALKLFSRKGLWVVLLAFCLLLPVVVLFGHGVLERIVDLPQESAFRLELYWQEIEMILQRPLFGYGGGAFTSAYPLFHRAPVETLLVVNKAHNSYLGLWIELGFIAGSIPLVMGLVTVATALRHFQNTIRSWVAPLAALGALTAGAVHSMTDFSLEVDGAFFFLLALLAVGTSTLAAAR